MQDEIAAALGLFERQLGGPRRPGRLAAGPVGAGELLSGAARPAMIQEGAKDHERLSVVRQASDDVLARGLDREIPEDHLGVSIGASGQDLLRELFGFRELLLLQLAARRERPGTDISSSISLEAKPFGGLPIPSLAGLGAGVGIPATGCQQRSDGDDLDHGSRERKFRSHGVLL